MNWLLTLAIAFIYIVICIIMQFYKVNKLINNLKLEGERKWKNK